MRASIAILMAASGCLYIGDVNRAPTSELTILSVDKTLIKGAIMQFAATLSDPEDGIDLQPVWTVESLEFEGADGNCDYHLNTSWDAGGQPLATLSFFRTGNWQVTVRTQDKFGAVSNTSTVMVQVIDAPPTFSTEDLSIKNTLDAECGSFVVSRPLAVYLDGTIEDPDAMLTPGPGCGSQYSETIHYRWEIVDMPATSHAVIGPKPGTQGELDCPTDVPIGLGKSWSAGPKDYPRAACVYTDVGGDANTKSLYRIKLFVSDGTTEIASHAFDAEVREDLPPCLTGAAPAPGAYVVDRNELLRFDVTGAVDDLDPFGDTLAYRWSIWRDADPEWRTVPSWALGSYSLDVSGFGVGENLRVRVEAIDRKGLRTNGCDLDDAVCAPSSCLTGASLACNAWMTWDLELR